MVFYGFGRVGTAALELALTRPWIEVRGIIAGSPASDGRTAAEVVPSAPPDLFVSTDAHATLRRANAAVVLVATRSTIPEILPHLRAAAEAGARAILCTAEELAWSRPARSAEMAAIHSLAAANGTAIVATGVNPGFVLDLWPLVLSGLAWDVRELVARRVVDVSVFAPHTRTRLGVGFTPDAFTQGVADGSISGHVGFPESLRILASAMGRTPERISVETLPVIAETRIELADGVVEAGLTAGASQQATAWVDGTPWIRIELLLHVAPAVAGLRTVDEIQLHGRHDLRVTVDPGCAAIMSTAAQLINGIPRAIEAPPGVYSPGDLAPSAPWLAETPPETWRLGR